MHPIEFDKVPNPVMTEERRALELFEIAFGSKPEVLGYAPGRVNLIVSG